MIAVVAITFSSTLFAQARPQVDLRAAIEVEESKGDVKGAIERYKKLADGRDRAVAAQALLRLGQAYQRLGDAEAKRVFERLVRDFGDQRDVVTQARDRLRQLGPPARTVQARPRMVPIWTGEDVGYGRPSADGRYIPYVAGTGDLALHDVIANTTRRMTNTGGFVASGDFARDPLVSPDNRLVAYTWSIEADGSSELRVLPTQGDAASPTTLIRAAQRFPAPLAWTPDGTRLIVSLRAADGWQLGIVTLRDGRYQALKTLGSQNPGIEASLSPDGRYLAYRTQSANSKRDIMILPLDGGSEVPALTGSEDDFNPLWSPDGAHLVFTRAETAAVGLWAVPMREGRPDERPTLIRPDLGRMNPLGITRDGSLYYALNGAVRHDIYIAQLDNSVARTSEVVTSQVFDGRTGPAWTPDGLSLTYWAAGARPGITLRSVKDGHERTIALPAGTVTNVASPKWFPDGRSLLLPAVSNAGNGFVLSRFDIQTGTMEQLHQGPGGPVSFAVAPDGSAIYWATADRLMRLDLKTRQEQELRRNEWFLSVAISPDGNELAYLKNERTAEQRAKGEAPGFLEVIPSRGGEPRRVFRAPIWYGPSRNNTLAWAPNQQSLVAVQDDGVLWRFPLDGGSPQSMGISAQNYRFGTAPSQPAPPGDRRVKSPAIHPDGRTLAFAVAEVLGREIWSLENVLPPAPGRK
jgi:Tol biopolymer transport system component